MNIRHRRLRGTEGIRKLVRNVSVSLDNFIYPLFIVEGNGIYEEISSMPGQYRFSPDKIPLCVETLHKLGISHVMLFGIPEKKDAIGSEAYAENGIVQQAVRAFKKQTSDITIITDVCMCEYTSHGHCGILDKKEVDNEKTLEYLGNIALSHARSGADMIAPSDMMDGRVGFIRNVLDGNDFSHIPIMSYSVKYASAYYGPFRDAAESAPQFGDRKSYQMDFARKEEPISEALQDVEEGADIIMVKPAMAYLDIIHRLRDLIHNPIAAYHVSGEYSMIKAASLKGWIDEKRVVMESMHAIKRAGADIIVTYHAPDIARWLKKDSPQ